MLSHSCTLQQRPARLRLETLEDRTVPSAYLISDPGGDFLDTYTGPHDPGLDVIAHNAVYIGDRVVFFGEMAGPVADTQAIGGIYVIGVDRGLGTPRFLSGTPQIGPNVLWDSIVRVNPNGTGVFNNQIAGVVTPIDPANITISGNTFTASVPIDVMLVGAANPPGEWTYNLWPRNGLVPGQSQHVSDLAPDDGNSPVQTVAPAQVASVVVNDGSAQRSMVNSLTVTFDGPVTISSGAFELSRHGGALVDLNVGISIVSGQTVALLTFSGPVIIGGSLADGSYTLTIRSDLVHDQWGRELDGDGNGSAGGDDATHNFHRLFGDADGDGDVDGQDRELFRSAFEPGGGGYLWYFDFDGDGDVDGLDNGQFNRRFGQS
jgi:hypothetical protein